MNAHLPTGTVTFLFTDIQGSTPVWEREPEKMAEALQVHNAALLQAIETYDGTVFKIVGDSFQAVFSTATQALNASIEGQRALHEAAWNALGELKVRMGLHTGEAELDPGGDEYAVSHTKNRAARIMSAAHGGQILLSQETADLVRRKLPERISLKDMGEHHLKGMQWSEHLFQVVAPDLREEFPPLSTSIAHQNNLPLQMTSFIGREKEVAQVCRLLEKHRLVTLTGSGGTGKTRLSLRVAAELLENYPNGAWLVELAPLADPALVVSAVASTMNLPETPGRSMLDSLKDYLCAKRLLLIIDNCEHLLDACARLADDLLQACPDLTILASSREFLGVEGEAPYRVPPMAMPEAQHLPSLEAVADYDAVRLFVERARVVLPDFTLTPGNAASVAQVVNRLDGIPLAIELAASRLRMLSVEQISLRLNDAFRLLTGGSRTVLPRHQTLRALIDWSYNLLSEPERHLLRRLSVFAGGWSLEAAEQVCAEQDEVFDLLSGLVDKSLVLPAQEGSSEMRYRMLETIRQYAHEKLVDEKESEATRTRHMKYFLNLVEILEPKIRSREQLQTLDRLELELDNLRLALEWGLQTDIEAELRMAASLQWLWHIRFHWPEGIEWLDNGLEAERTTRAETPLEGRRLAVRAKALVALGFHRSMDYYHYQILHQIKPSFDEALRLCRSSSPENKLTLAWALVWQSGILRFEGDLTQSMLVAKEALELFRQLGDQHGIAESLVNVGFCEADPARKKQSHLESLAIEEANGDIEGIATAYQFIGWDAWDTGEFEEARSAFEASLNYYRQVNNPIMIVTTGGMLGLSSLHSGDLGGAMESFEGSLAQSSDLGNAGMVETCLFFRCWLVIAEGLFDQARSISDQMEYNNQKSGDPTHTADILCIRARLARLRGDHEAASQFTQELMSLEQKLDHHLSLGLLEQGYLALQNGNLEQAEAHFREGIQLTINKHIDFWFNSGYLDGMARLASRTGKTERAALLCGSRWSRGYVYTLSPIERDWREADLAGMKAALGEERLKELFEEGSQMTFEQAVQLALEE